MFLFCIAFICYGMQLLDVYEHTHLQFTELLCLVMFNKFYMAPMIAAILLAFNGALSAHIYFNYIGWYYTDCTNSVIMLLRTELLCV